MIIIVQYLDMKIKLFADVSIDLYSTLA